MAGFELLAEMGPARRTTAEEIRWLMDAAPEGLYPDEDGGLREGIPLGLWRALPDSPPNP